MASHDWPETGGVLRNHLLSHIAVGLFEGRHENYQGCGVMYKPSIQMGVFTMARPGRTSSPAALTQRGRVLPWRLGPERNRSRAQFRWLPPGPSSQ